MDARELYLMSCFVVALDFNFIIQRLLECCYYDGKGFGGGADLKENLLSKLLYLSVPGN